MDHFPNQFHEEFRPRSGQQHALQQVLPRQSKLDHKTPIQQRHIPRGVNGHLSDDAWTHFQDFEQKSPRNSAPLYAHSGRHFWDQYISQQTSFGLSEHVRQGDYPWRNHAHSMGYQCNDLQALQYVSEKYHPQQTVTPGQYLFSNTQASASAACLVSAVASAATPTLVPVSAIEQPPQLSQVKSVSKEVILIDESPEDELVVPASRERRPPQPKKSLLQLRWYQPAQPAIVTEALHPALRNSAEGRRLVEDAERVYRRKVLGQSVPAQAESQSGKKRKAPARDKGTKGQKRAKRTHKAAKRTTVTNTDIQLTTKAGNVSPDMTADKMEAAINAVYHAERGKEQDSSIPESGDPGVSGDQVRDSEDVQPVRQDMILGETEAAGLDNSSEVGDTGELQIDPPDMTEEEMVAAIMAGYNDEAEAANAAVKDQQQSDEAQGCATSSAQNWSEEESEVSEEE